MVITQNKSFGSRLFTPFGQMTTAETSAVCPSTARVLQFHSTSDNPTVCTSRVWRWHSSDAALDVRLTSRWAAVDNSASALRDLAQGNHRFLPSAESLNFDGCRAFDASRSLRSKNMPTGYQSTAYKPRGALRWNAELNCFRARSEQGLWCSSSGRNGRLSLRKSIKTAESIIRFASRCDNKTCRKTNASRRNR